MFNSIITESVETDVFFQYTGAATQLLSGMVFYMLIARIFSTSTVGAIALFVALLGVFVVVFQFGLVSAVQHFTAYHIGAGDIVSAKHIIKNLLLLATSLAFGGFLILLLLANQISTILLHDQVYAGLIRILSLALFGQILFGILNGTLLGIGKFKLSAIISSITWIAYYFGSVFLADLFRGVDFVVYGWIIGIWIGVSVDFLYIKKYVGKLKQPNSRTTYSEVLSYSAPIMLSSIIGYGATYVDRFVVAGLLNLSQLGVYNLALLIGSSIGFLATPFNNMLLPKFSEYFGSKNSDVVTNVFRVSTLALTFIFVPVSLGILSISSLIINLLGGTDYASGVIPMDIIIVFGAVFVSQNILSQVIASMRKTSLFFRIGVISLSVNLSLSILLVPHLGNIGASIGFASVYITTFCISFIYARNNAPISYDLSGIVKVWVASILMYFVVHIVAIVSGEQFIFLPLYIISGVSFYILVSRALKVFSDEESIIISSFLSKNQGILVKIFFRLMLFTE